MIGMILFIDSNKKREIIFKKKTIIERFCFKNDGYLIYIQHSRILFDWKPTNIRLNSKRYSISKSFKAVENSPYQVTIFDGFHNINCCEKCKYQIKQQHKNSKKIEHNCRSFRRENHYGKEYQKGHKGTHYF